MKKLHNNFLFVLVLMYPRGIQNFVILYTVPILLEEKNVCREEPQLRSINIPVNNWRVVRKLTALKSQVDTFASWDEEIRINSLIRETSNYLHKLKQ